MSDDMEMDAKSSDEGVGAGQSSTATTSQSSTDDKPCAQSSKSSANSVGNDCATRATAPAPQEPIAATARSACTSTGATVKRKFRSLTFGRSRKKSLQCLANNKCKQNCGNHCCNNATNGDNHRENQKNSTTNSNHSNGSNEIKSSQRKKKSSGVWVPFKLCARTDSCADVRQSADTGDADDDSCVCTAYKKTVSVELQPLPVVDGDHQMASTSSGGKCGDRFNRLHNTAEAMDDRSRAINGLTARDMSTIDEFSMANTSRNTDTYMETYGLASGGANSPDTTGAYPMPTYGGQRPVQEVRTMQVKVSELALALRSQLSLTVSPYPYLARWGEVAELTPGFLNRFCVRSDSAQGLSDGGCPQIHTQIDYIHCLVPDLMAITRCGFYWGKMDRYEAERLLDNKPEGTFLLRDSAQEEHLFSVSFRRFDRSLHARIEQWNHKFSFDSHDPGVYSSDTVCGLIEHYKDPAHCMFFEPMLTIPLHRNFTFPL
ncbi:unnamed protein product, partial [Oppiella nova]